jgi:hypothetical protein
VTNAKLILDGNCITKAASVKYLGIFIDEGLNWTEHIKHVHNNILKFAGIFYKIRYKLPSACLKSLYYATAYPLLHYGIELYANTHKSYLHDLMILNNKLLRILQSKPYMSPIKGLYSEYNTLQLDYLHDYKLLLMMHRYINERHTLPEIFSDYFTINSSVHNHNTRSNMDMHLTLYTSNFGKRCLDYRGSKLWNGLPNVLKNIKSQFSFKKELKKYFQNMS